MIESLTEEITLVNLISMNESNLERNFKLIMNRFNKQ